MSVAEYYLPKVVKPSSIGKLYFAITTTGTGRNVCEGEIIQNIKTWPFQIAKLVEEIKCSWLC